VLARDNGKVRDFIPSTRDPSQDIFTSKRKMENRILLLLLVILLASASVALMIRLIPLRSDPFNQRNLESLYAKQKVSREPQLSGGILTHVMTLEQTMSLLAKSPFSMNGNDRSITDCSQPDKDGTGSCSAWTYLRSDLLPMIFNTPNSPDSGSTGSNSSEKIEYSTPVVGIIVDPSLIWPLITSMGVVDASTNERNCGQYFFNSSDRVPVVCNESDKGIGKSGGFAFQGPLKASDICQANCEIGDTYCKYQNSGGNVALSFLGKSKIGNWGCRDCSGPFPKEGISGSMAGCSQSSFPNICSLNKGPRDPSSLVDPDAWAPYSKSEGYARVHVGDGAERFVNLFEGEEGLRDIADIGRGQCKFRRDDWFVWISTIKLFYKTWNKYYDPVQKTLRSESDAKNFLMSCPENMYSFMENEVNLYFNPSSEDPQFKDIAEKQSNILRNAIVGFFFVGKKCEEQLASLEGSKIKTSSREYTGAKDRCDGWYCGKNPSRDCLDRFRKNEEKYLAKGREMARELTKKFNAAYRTGGKRTPAGLFKYVGGNSTFIDPKYLKSLEKGETIPLREVFQEVS